uniref:Uncharacterized protein n=1 Tax=Panagrolaimus sp. PS1159 TaxID=55785 RepID=A0AC35G6I3_9BILA
MNKRSNDDAKRKKQISRKRPLRRPIRRPQQPVASSSNEAQVATPSRHRLNSKEQHVVDLQKPERMVKSDVTQSLKDED